MLNLNANDFTRANHILSFLERIAIKRGYEEVFTETLGAYSSRYDASALKIMAPTGEILTLKNDPTPSVTKLMAPLCQGYRKCYYKSSTIELDANSPSGIKERLYGGIEYFGNKHLESDVEILVLVLSVLSALGIQNLKVDIGDLDFTTFFLIEAGFAKEEIPLVLSSLSKRSTSILKTLTNSQRTVYEKLLALNGPSELIFARAKDYALSKALQNQINTTHEIVQRLNRHTQFKYDIGLDFSMAHPRPYYSGTIYKIYAIETGKTVAKGGRYDGLSKEWGYDFPACGAAMDIKNILEVINMKQKNVQNKTDFALVYDANDLNKAIALSDWLLENGFSVKLNEKPADFITALKTEYYTTVDRILELENGALRVLDQKKNESYRLSADALKQKLTFESSNFGIH